MNRRKLVAAGVVVGLVAVALWRQRRREAASVSEDESDGRPVPIEERGGGAASTEEPTDEEGATAPLESLEGIGPAYAARLREAGVEDTADLEAADAADLAESTGIGERRIRGWIETAGDRA